MAQAIFKSWFVDFEPFQNGEFIDSELGKIPKGWRVSSLDSIACYMNGIAMQKYKPEAEEFLPVIKIKELNQGFTDNNSDKASINIPEQHIIRNGDVLFSWSGTLLVKIWAGDIGGLNQHLFKVTSENYDKWFYYLWTLNYLDKFRAIAEDKATTMGHIKRKHLSEAMVLIPKFSDMNYMSNIMNPVIDKITELNSQNSCIRLIRDALLPKLMSGEVRVPIEEVL
ncbi:MAG: restriction endonuclease subunit S [Aminobacterium colombiense]|nr:restriction endonuclease subunit S [Aminobacterium colombiense]